MNTHQTEAGAVPVSLRPDDALPESDMISADPNVTRPEPTDRAQVMLPRRTRDAVEIVAHGQYGAWNDILSVAFEQGMPWIDKQPEVGDVCRARDRLLRSNVKGLSHLLDDWSFKWMPDEARTKKSSIRNVRTRTRSMQHKLAARLGLSQTEIAVIAINVGLAFGDGRVLPDYIRAEILAETRRFLDELHKRAETLTAHAKNAAPAPLLLLSRADIERIEREVAAAYQGDAK